ncbi:MAG: DUF362 domain-containing protein [Nitrososphaerota archaeon]|nr:DUF362 domain-containing protein [Candidatus Bathyarchaeota archaeon]MDW8193229.1 DUF362 domain-containing protein [Nitrososphaerota archaeon]
MSRVAIVKGSDPVNTTLKALEIIGGDALANMPTDKPILVKPNLINAQPPSTGITTDGRVVEGVVRFLMQNGWKNIIIGEGSGFADTFEAFNAAGIDKVAEKWKVKLVDLNRDNFVEVHPSGPLALKRVKLAKTALESTIVSVPKLKVHRLATVTLGLKNMMGALAHKGKMHNGHLSKNIVDLASVLRPSLTVIDGIIAGEIHETSGSPVRMDLIIAGADPVAVDAVGAAVMGINPEEVDHLVLAERKGLGTCCLENIEIIGESIDKVKRKFRRSMISRILSSL